ncbi:MAG: (2Fe-2S)-binding protein [Planctomycetes bacterium]|nr:(2Fe-2S)-binding protein [Planctomycetota bacterium]
MPKLTYLPTGATLEVAAGSRYADVCRREDLPQPFGCTVGSCGTCCVVLVEGYERCDAPSAEELETLEMCTSEKHTRLGCQLVLRGDVQLRPVD